MIYLTDSDVLSALKESIREELDKKADEIIEKRCQDLRSELSKQKHILISKMLDEIEFLVMENSRACELVFQINLKRG